MCNVMYPLPLGGDCRKSISLAPNRTATHQLARFEQWSLLCDSYHSLCACSHAVRRSRALVWHAKMKKNVPKSEQYCMFFNRFGKFKNAENYNLVFFRNHIN